MFYPEDEQEKPQAESDREEAQVEDTPDTGEGEISSEKN